MRLHQSIQTKQTTRLFNGKYKYKIVLLSKAASWFRGGELANVKKNIGIVAASSIPWVKKLTPQDIDYVLKLVTALTPMTEYIVRIESPYINFYTNTDKDIEKLAKINPEFVKYVCIPSPGSESELELNKIIVKNIDHEFRVTMGRTRQNHSNFVAWAADKDKLRLPKRAKNELAKDRSWGGYYFYVKDEKTLTMVKMFVGGEIQSIERCVKQ